MARINVQSENKTIYQHIGKILRKERKSRKITILEVARRLNRSRDFVLDAEAGRFRMTLDKVYEYCEVLDIPIKSLLPEYMPGYTGDLKNGNETGAAPDQFTQMKNDLTLFGTQINRTTLKIIKNYMTEYAVQVAKQALKNAAENCTLVEENGRDRGSIVYDYYDNRVSISKESILNKNNIPEM